MAQFNRLKKGVQLFNETNLNSKHFIIDSHFVAYPLSKLNGATPGQYLYNKNIIHLNQKAFIEADGICHISQSFCQGRRFYTVQHFFLKSIFPKCPKISGLTEQCRAENEMEIPVSLSL